MRVPMAILLTAATAWAQAAAPVVDEHTLLLAHFDQGFDADFARGSKAAEVKGARLVDGGQWGRALDLHGGVSLSFDVRDNLKMSAGTLSFWLKPSWDPATPGSHALLSMGLDGDPSGYFVLSQGWWETGGGAGRLYFVLDNQAYMHASSPVFAAMGEHLREWHQVVLTWHEGKPGSVFLYVDGEPAASTVRQCQLRQPRTRLFLGSDAPTGMGAQRPAEALLDELVIYDRELTRAEVAAAYQAQEPRWAEIQARRWAWLTDTLKGPAPTYRRDARGRVMESRALLDESHLWSIKETADAIVAKLRRAGFNVYVPCVWHGRGTYWPTPLEPPASYLKIEPDRDPLAYLIERCHAAGIEVHPWFCVTSRSDERHPELAEEGTPKGHFDAHRPEYRDWIVALMLDVVRRYQVDGISLDYIRTGGLCQGPKCAAEYQARYGTALAEEAKKPEANGWANARVVEWQNEAIADLVRRLAVEGRKLKPGLIVSADVHAGLPTEAPATDGRNVFPWLTAGWLDVAYDMDYGQFLSHERLTAARKALPRPAALVDLVGNYERTEQGQVVPRDGKLVADLISFCQRRWPGNGVGLYLYSMLSDQQIAALRAGPFRDDAVPCWERAAP